MSEDQKHRLPLFSFLYRMYRVAYLTAVLWCCSMLIVMLVVNRSGKGRYPGTVFSRDVFPIAAYLVSLLFFVGAGSVEISKQAAESTAIRWCIYISFAATVFALWLFVTSM